MVYYVLYMQMRGKLYTFGRNGSNKFLYILPSACFATFPAVARAKSPAAYAMSGHQKWQKLPCCGLLGARCQRLSRRRIYLISLAFCQRCYRATLPVPDSAMRPLRSAVYHISKKTAQIALFATSRANKTNW